MKNEDKIKKIQGITTAWTNHIVFAQWIVNKINPKVIVDLGVDYGYSTFSFAIPQIGHVYGIDSFEGDYNTGIRDTIEIANENKKSLELDNITFIKGYFDEIAKVWDKPIDILHIDGFHSYEAVKNDYETWSKFLNDDGVILFHDTIVEDKSFGVKKFFEEIDLPKVNFTCSFGLGVVSKNKEIIEEISKFFNLPLHVPQKKDDKIAVFYHFYQQNSWKDLYNEQINSLINSGIYDKCDFIHIGINGDQELPFILDKMRINYNENKILEADTLKSLYDFCNENPDYKILYFHSKGITYTEDNYLSTTTNSWRKYLEYYVINKWEECVEDLNEYDCVGTEWINESRLWNSNLNDYSNEINPHYSGNFWWANAEYLKNLDLNYIYNDEKDWARWKSEFWIGTKNPKYKSYHNSNKPLYDFNYTPDYYMKTESLTDKKPKIVMISMFKNESKGIRRMLESVYKHIDFYVFQDNGSTDGTPEIVEEFFADKNIPGFIYQIEEGWVGFGWNRDHLLQTCIKTDHGCDWIMKMDCDEYLEVDDDFDWSPFYNTNTESFHVTAQSPGCIYYRAWIWNAKLPWKFQHDPAHEVIYLDNEKGENFERLNLSRGLRMIGTNDGESYTVRTKYITDALKLEERLIREETMLTDTYHFWYIAKSYQDCYGGGFYPLGESHSKEFARRFIFYFEEYLKHVNAQGIHEMSYFSAFSIGLGHKYLGNYAKAIEWFNTAEKYCPVRNEHIVHLAQTYNELKQYDKMLEQTTKLINPERKLPFPDYYFLINSNIYCDSSDYPQNLHNYALSKVGEEKSINSFSVNITTKPRLWIVDDFYADPHAVREFALKQEFEPNLNYYKGSRSNQQYIVPGTKEAFEKIIGKKITNWTETHGMCGRFQYCTAEDSLVYHCDGQTLAGMIYLTPDAPYSCGTSLYAHKRTGLRNENDFGDVNVFEETGFYDKSKFELVDTAGNVFNRLVLFDAKCIHSANEYFGTNLTNSRLFHLFFFD